MGPPTFTHNIPAPPPMDWALLTHRAPLQCRLRHQSARERQLGASRTLPRGATPAKNKDSQLAVTTGGRASACLPLKTGHRHTRGRAFPGTDTCTYLASEGACTVDVKQGEEKAEAAVAGAKADTSQREAELAEVNKPVAVLVELAEHVGAHSLHKTRAIHGTGG